MNRRKFLSRMAALPALPLLLKSCDWTTDRFSFPIHLHSDRKTGHLIFDSNQYPIVSKDSVKTLIVGGGIAGLSAAKSLNHQDFILCELSDRLGGTSASMDFNGIPLAQGAHYDLEYPANYGESVLSLMQESGIIKYKEWKNSWRFTDQQYIIPHELKNQCYDNGIKRPDVLEESELRDDFHKLMSAYSGKMPMPTRLINQDLRNLNDLTFIEFLKNKIKLNDAFIRGLDYHMLDDWGGTAGQVSAIAGIHYFQCRPYYNEVNQLFSPPQGNDYFVDKIASQLPSNQVRTNMLVRKVIRIDDKWKIDVVDVINKEIIQLTAEQVIYAGQKHALKYIMPEYYYLFQENTYAPWLVINIVLDKPFDSFGFWQNEVLVEDQSFLGFINSAAQHHTLQKKQVFTGYYCLPFTSRKDLVSVEDNKDVIVQKTIKYLEDYFGESISDRIEAVFINTMGHAMPIPKPGYLFQDKTQLTKDRGLAFAGVDHHRLPLLFEAIDSGIEAAKALSF